MCALHARYPQYGFDRHKGYGTSEHLDLLGRVGPCEIHRKSFYAVGVFFDKGTFSETWSRMSEALRVRSYRLYCEALRLSAGYGLAASTRGGPRLAAAKARLVKFDLQQKRLKREYADVLASKDASSHVELVADLLRNARAQLRAGIKIC
jgi:hypothetical protein